MAVSARVSNFLPRHLLSHSAVASASLQEKPVHTKSSGGDHLSTFSWLGAQPPLSSSVTDGAWMEFNPSLGFLHYCNK